MYHQKTQITTITLLKVSIYLCYRQGKKILKHILILDAEVVVMFEIISNISLVVEQDCHGYCLCHHLC